MNAKQKLHQTLLAKWTALFQEQSMSGLTIREWCSQNNVPIHKFNYWKHVAKETYVDSVLPDIVPIAPSSPLVPDTLFLFCGHRLNKIKGLVWEGDGFLLLTKRVDDGRFSWPGNSNEARMLSAKQFEYLMNGFAIDPVIRMSHPEKYA